ncbi:hypothetical protein BUALT_Bualt02G0009400 [Buddleja alternifolia]|uniref:Uncharacterized protein n=1 Tax=Buddleja alternifolia TaxID=168488 RepID=A0AAV6XXU5_9LAMI|nr:hypothetical protein BUALT_Bualt02G0009400 [Buddleja alternifolia]
MDADFCAGDCWWCVGLGLLESCLDEFEDNLFPCTGEMLKCFPPSKRLSKRAPLIHVMKIKITAKDFSSLEKSKAIISNLTMAPTVGESSCIEMKSKDLALVLARIYTCQHRTYAEAIKKATSKPVAS